MTKPETPIKSATTDSTIGSNKITTKDVATEFVSGSKDIYEGGKNTVRVAGMLTGISFLGAIALAFTKFCTEGSLFVLKIASRAIKMEEETRKKVDATFDSYISFIDNLGGAGIKGTFDKFFGNDAIKTTGTIMGLRATSALAQSNSVYNKQKVSDKNENKTENDNATNERANNANNFYGLKSDGTDEKWTTKITETNAEQGQGRS